MGRRGVVGRGVGVEVGVGVCVGVGVGVVLVMGVTEGEDVGVGEGVGVGTVRTSRPWISGRGNTRWPSEVTRTGVGGVGVTRSRTSLGEGGRGGHSMVGGGQWACGGKWAVDVWWEVGGGRVV